MVYPSTQQMLSECWKAFLSTPTNYLRATHAIPMFTIQIVCFAGPNKQ